MDGEFDGIDLGDLPERLNEIAGEEPEAIVETAWTAGDPCFHKRSRVFQQDRKVMCRDCGVDLDPIDVLYTIAREPGHWLAMLRQHRQMARQARDRLEDLLRQERNARARVKRLNEQQKTKP